MPGEVERNHRPRPVVGEGRSGIGRLFAEAVQHFSLLTVGEGLVNQIPALLISTATGIIVTRSVGESNLGQDLANQMISQPRALFLAGIVATSLGLLPGLPKLPFFIIGGVMLLVSSTLKKGMREDAEAAAQDEATAVAPAPAEPENETIPSRSPQRAQEPSSGEKPAASASFKLFFIRFQTPLFTTAHVTLTHACHHAGIGATNIPSD